VVVPELLRDAAPGDAWRPRVRRVDGRCEVEIDGRTMRSIVHELVDPDGILSTLERRGVDRVVLCPLAPLLFYEAEPAAALERCRIQNEGLAAMRAFAPDRIDVLGCVPLQDPALAAEALVELIATGSFAGVEVTASVAGAYLGEPQFEPFWEAAAATRALVFVHPTTRGFSLPVMDRHYLWNLVGNPFETTLAAAQLILAGTLLRHPGLRILLAHGGGAITTLAGRLSHGQYAVAAAGPVPVSEEQQADAQLRRFLFDSVTHSGEQLAELVRAVGAERVLLGSDYPFDMGDQDPVAMVRAAGLGAEAELAVLGGNAARELCVPRSG
jgi:aminocarboxymuconate-semialdehyde decarboxylase